MTHAGIRLGIPSALVRAVTRLEPAAKTRLLWPGDEAVDSEGQHAFELKAPGGSCFVRASRASLSHLPGDALVPISPFLRHYMTLPHVVGVAEIRGVLTWLVDPMRLRPANAESGHPASLADSAT